TGRRFLGNVVHKALLLDRCPQRVEGAREVGDVVTSDPHDRLGEGARLAGVASEDHDARIKVLASQEGVALELGGANRDVPCPGEASGRELLGRPAIEKHGRTVDVENANDPVQLDLGYLAERAPDRDAELVSPHVGEPGADQLLTNLSASLAERTVTVEHQRL